MRGRLVRGRPAGKRRKEPLTDKEAADSSFAAENGVVWVTLRPRANASTTSPDMVSIETLLFGVPAVRVYKSLGGRP